MVSRARMKEIHRPCPAAIRACRRSTRCAASKQRLPPGAAAAAEELSLTPSAISHQIRALETHLGLKLFLRLNPGLALTEDGRQMLRGVEAGFRARGGDGPREARTQRRIITVVALAGGVLLASAPPAGLRRASSGDRTARRVVRSGEPFFARDQLDLSRSSSAASMGSSSARTVRPS